MDPVPGLTVVLLGDSGVGKSASANTILGRAAFESRRSLAAVTQRITEASAEVCGKQVDVVDTPGIFGAEEQVRSWCRDLLRSCRPCLFLLVFRVGRVTSEHMKVLAAADRVLGPHGLNKCYLLFTGADSSGTWSLEDLLSGESSPLISSVSGRCHLFNNQDGGQDQVRELLEKSGHLRARHPLERPVRLVLLGVPGGGKSSSGNTILGSDQFRSAGGFNSVCTETVCKSATVGGRQVTVVDPPGFADAVLTPRLLQLEVERLLDLASPGPHALLVVVRVGSMSSTDVRLCELLPGLFAGSARRFCVVLFTHGDELGGRSIAALIQSNRHVKKLVSTCDGRYCVFDNRAGGSRQQVRKLLRLTDELLEANGGRLCSLDSIRGSGTGRRGGVLTRLWARTKGFVRSHRSALMASFSLSLILTGVWILIHHESSIINND